MSVDEIFRSDGHSQSADGDHWKRENQGPPQRDDRTEGVAPEAWVDDLDDGVFECLFFFNIMLLLIICIFQTSFLSSV